MDISVRIEMKNLVDDSAENNLTEVLYVNECFGSFENMF